MLSYLFTQTPLLFFVQNLWRDEAFSYVLAAKSVIDIFKLTAGDFNPPLYYILLHFSMQVFGHSEIALRALSLLFFLGTIYILYDTCLYVLKIPHKRTLVYFLFIICNPFLLTYAFEARMYMMVTFFVTLSYFSLLTGRKKLFILSSVLGLYTHYFSVFIYAIQVLTELFVLWDKNRHYSFFFKILTDLKYFFLQLLTGRKQKQTAFQFTSYIIPALFFLPWVIFILIQHDFSDGAFWIITPPLKDLFYLPFILYTGYERIFGLYYHGAAGYSDFHRSLTFILWTILLIPLFYWINELRINNRLSWTTRIKLEEYRPNIDIVLWSFFPPLFIFVISYITQPLFLPRYFIFAAPGFLLSLIIAFEKILVHNTKIKRLNLVLAAVFALFITIYTQKFNTLNLQYHSKRNIKELYTEIKDIKQPEDLIYLDSELDYHLALYYMGLNEKIFIYNKTYEGIPQYVGKVLIPAEALTQVLPIYPVRAFVVYYHWYNIRSLN